MDQTAAHSAGDEWATLSDAIKIYPPYDISSCRPQKTTNYYIFCLFVFGGIEKLFCTLDQSLKLKNYASVSTTIRLQFSGIKNGGKFSFPSRSNFINHSENSHSGVFHQLVRFL